MKAIRWTPEQLAQHHKKLVIPKFKNIKTLGYDSKRESNRATDLRMMAQAGIDSRLARAG